MLRLLMAAAASLVASPLGEQRILLSNISWKDYVLIRDVLEGPGVRMTYLGGVLELMSPSPMHELWKTNIARLVELYAHIKRIDLRGYGSTTFRQEAKLRGAEPDECYLIGKTLADMPDIVLEVIHTSPLIDKLDVYAGMGIPEVWVFREGAFSIHGLDPAQGRYSARSSSPLLPALDFAVVARYAVREDTPQALREFESQVRA
jgi:Uma2 family endonuclease